MVAHRRAVYLETSFISACVTNRRDPKSVYRRETSLEWWLMKRRHFSLFASGEVFQELNNPTYPLRDAALRWLDPIPLLPITEESLGLAEILIHEKLMPQTLSGDAIHVSIAAICRCEYILSWNVRHLANPNKRVHLRKVLTKLGMMAPEIVTPDMLWED